MRKGLEASFEGGGDFETHFLPGGNGDAFAGAGAHALTGGGLGDAEGAEAGQTDALAAAQGSNDGVEDGGDGLPGLFLVQAGFVRDHFDQLGLGDLVTCGRSGSGLLGGRFVGLEQEIKWGS